MTAAHRRVVRSVTLSEPSWLLTSNEILVSDGGFDFTPRFAATLGRAEVPAVALDP